MIKNNSRATRRYQPNPQQELFALLTPRQQQVLAGILRDLKPRAQGKLCQKLIDYLNNGRMEMSSSFVVDSLAIYLAMPSNSHCKPNPLPLLSTGNRAGEGRRDMK